MSTTATVPDLDYYGLDEQTVAAMPARLRDRAAELAVELDTFEWKGRETTWAILFDPAQTHLRLSMTLWAADSQKILADEDPGDGGFLTVICDDTGGAPAQEIRDVIHQHLCHEADELMLFDGKVLFDPHSDDR